jgi:hypothetical protein
LFVVLQVFFAVRASDFATMFIYYFYLHHRFYFRRYFNICMLTRNHQLCGQKKAPSRRAHTTTTAAPFKDTHSWGRDQKKSVLEPCSAN